MEKSLAHSFSALYQKINADGTMDPFFHRPEVFGVGSNDFAAAMLILEKILPRLPASIAPQVEAAISVCRQALEENSSPLPDDRLEWDLILHLLAALAAEGENR